MVNTSDDLRAKLLAHTPAKVNSKSCGSAYKPKTAMQFLDKADYSGEIVKKGIQMTTNPFDPGYYTEDDLIDAGFKALGKNVRIAKHNTIIGPENIAIGDNVRIDDYCIIIAAGDGYLSLGSYIHIGGWCYLSAGGSIKMEDFSGLSQGVRIYSRTDDYSGIHLTNPTVPARYTGITRGAVELGKHVIIGSGTVILPKVKIGDGSAVGALSLVTKDLDPWGVYFGCPARRVKGRSKRLLELEAELTNDAALQGAPGQ